MPEDKEKVKSAKPILSWESPEAVHYKRGATWFISVGVIALAFAALLYWQQQLSGALVAVVAAVVIMIIAGAKPKHIKCAIYEDGIVVDGKTYRFDQFKSFWMSGVELIKTKLQLVGTMAGQVTMPLKGVDVEEIRLYLKKHLPEEEDKGEDLIDTINRWIKF